MLSVVIPTFNRAPILERTLGALASQSLLGREEEPFEVLIVDDGSADHTEQVVRTSQTGFPVPLRYFRQPNRKQGAARNLGVQHARAEWIVFLGDDTIPTSNFLEEHRRSLRPEAPRVVVIGYTPWSSDCRVTRFMRYIGEQGWQFGFSLIRDPQDVPFNFFYTSNLGIQRDFFLSAGGFDEDFREYGWEDIELSVRLKKQGMRLVYNPRAVAHHLHPTSLARFIQRQQKVGFSALTFYRKHPELSAFLSLQTPPRYSRAQRLKMALLTRVCSLTETWSWPDLSRYYPDLMSYYYNLGILQALRNE